MSGMNVYATNVQPHCDACGSLGTEPPSDEVVAMTTRLREALHVGLVVQAKRAGCTAQQLKDAGYTALELRYGGFGGEEVTNAGYTAMQLREAGACLWYLRQQGFDARTLALTGASRGFLIAAGFSETEAFRARQI